MTILVDLAAVAALVFIVWWFWLYRPHPVLPAAVPGRAIDIVVADGVYTPSEIAVPAGHESVLRFLRKDRSPCAAMLLIDDLGISAELPVDVPVEIRVHPEKPGRHEFTCQMRMYRGTLVVQEEKR